MGGTRFVLIPYYKTGRVWWKTVNFGVRQLLNGPKRHPINMTHLHINKLSCPLTHGPIFLNNFLFIIASKFLVLSYQYSFKYFFPRLVLIPSLMMPFYHWYKNLKKVPNEVVNFKTKTFSKTFELLKNRFYTWNVGRMTKISYNM